MSSFFPFLTFYKEKSEIEIKPVTDKWLDIDKKDDKEIVEIEESTNKIEETN